MYERIKFKTLAELQDKYPVGSVFKSCPHRDYALRYFYNEKDLKILKQQYDTVAIVGKNMCQCWKTVTYTKIVEGYLYDGEYWYPAHQTHDGWIEYDEYDLKEE